MVSRILSFLFQRPPTMVLAPCRRGAGKGNVVATRLLGDHCPLVFLPSSYNPLAGEGIG